MADRRRVDDHRRDVQLAEFTGGRYHACHISTAESVEVIRWAKKRGIALQSSSYYDRFVRAVFDQGAKAAAPDVPEAETQVFAAALAQELKREDGQ